MRKAVVLLLLVILAFGLILYRSGVSLVHAASAVPGEIPSRVQEDLEYVLNNADIPQLAVSFSHEEHFYSETITVEIAANNPDAAIYCTLDGSTPTAESERYVQPFIFQAGEDTDCYVLKAVAIDDGGASPVLTHSYFVGENVYERFGVDYVFSLSSEPDGLYGYENGILVSGKVQDDYVAENPDADISNWRTPANYNMRGRGWERPVYVEVLTPDGERVIAQNAGMRVHGNSIRGLEQKSLRLTARNIYDNGNGKFEYALFDNMFTDSKIVKPIIAYDTVILRYDAFNFRDFVVSNLAKGAGYKTISPQAIAAVFLNGEYYGFAFLLTQLNEQYLQSLFDTPERAFDIYDGGVSRLGVGGNKDVDEEYRAMFAYAQQNLNEDAVKWIESFFSVDDLLLYYAIQLYTANSDWWDKAGNVKIWRYTGVSDAGNSAVEQDRRWRFILFDLDATFHFDDYSAPHLKTIDSIYYGQNPFLRTLFQSDKYQEKFVNYICDFAFDHFSVEEIQHNLQKLDGGVIPELYERLHRHGDDDFGEYERNQKKILEFAEQRPDYVLDDLVNLLNYSSEMYSIKSDGSCKINTLNGNEGIYFIECSVPITPRPKKGQAFDHWLVNGEIRREEELTVSVSDADTDGIVYVQCITREELPPLFFGDSYDNGKLCGFTMYNPTDRVQNTQGLYLSDNIDNLRKWAFPNMNIRPGSVWEFVGESSTSIDALMKIGLNFNPRYGEVIFLSNEDGDILDYIAMMP